MDSDEFREITGVDGMNNNSLYQNNATSDNEIVVMESQDSNNHEIAGVAQEWQCKRMTGPQEWQFMIAAKM